MEEGKMKRALHRNVVPKKCICYNIIDAFSRYVQLLDMMFARFLGQDGDLLILSSCGFRVCSTVWMLSP